jgi:heat shock protein HslJ
MRTSAIRMMLALASVATIFAALSLAVTFARVQQSSGGNSLSGTSWQLVKFQRSDERTFAPDDKSKYTIRFGRDGHVAIRVDCNRGSSTWRVTAKGELQFGSWSRTTAKCGPGSLHDQIVTEGAAVRNFAIKDGHLFLSGMAAGGYYELEPMPAAKR